MGDGLQEILYSLQRNKLRTGLTAFGVFWGIFMLVMLLGAGAGLKNGIEKGFSSDLRNSLWIQPFKTTVPYKGLAFGREIRFTEADMKALREQLPGLDLLSAENPLGSFTQADTQVTYANRSGNYGVFGVANDYFKIKRYQDYRRGRRLNNLDHELRRKVVVAGTAVVEKLFPGQNPLGLQVNINGVSFKIVGVFYDSGWEGRMSERLYMPLSTFQKTFGEGEYISLLTATPRPGVNGEQLAQRMVAILQQRHNISPDDPRAIQYTNLEEQSRELNATIGAINFFIWFVGLGTMAAGIVGISNIMIITVKERTVEIGVRKALGAAPLNIVATVLMECMLVTAVAGYCGLVLAIGLLELINFLMVTFHMETRFFVNPEVDFNIAMAALMVLLGSGTIAGFIPAWQAARISPIAAMRAE